MRLNLEAFVCEHMDEVAGTVSICFSCNFVVGEIPKQISISEIYRF